MSVVRPSNFPLPVARNVPRVSSSAVPARSLVAPSQTARPVIQPCWNIRQVPGPGTQIIEAILPGQPKPVGQVDVPIAQGRAEIRNLRVLPEFQRQSIGSGLVRRAVQLAQSRGFASVALIARPGAPGVSAQNLVAMYQKLGFRTTGTTPHGPRMEFGYTPLVRQATAPAVQRRLTSAPTPGLPGTGRSFLPTPATPTLPGSRSSFLARPGGNVQRMLSGGTVQRMLSGITLPSTLTQNQTTWARKLEGRFGMAAFTLKEYCDYVESSVGHGKALRILGELRTAGVLYPPIIEKVREGLILSFDSSKAKQAPAHTTGNYMTNRQAFGMTNPPHNHPNMVPFWETHAHTPPPQGRDEIEHYMSPSRNFYIGDNQGNQVVDNSGNRIMIQGHSNTVIGHSESAGAYVNRVGHQYSPGTNRQHNYLSTTYGQVDDKYASAASGAQEERYRSPSPTRGSWEGYYDSGHARFKEDYRYRWPSHIRKTCSCGNNMDHEAAITCSKCGKAY